MKNDCRRCLYFDHKQGTKKGKCRHRMNKGGTLEDRKCSSSCPDIVLKPIIIHERGPLTVDRKGNQVRGKSPIITR